MTIKLSIIIPVYNSKKYLKGCLNSICKQVKKNVEVIIVNDCSADGSIKICKNFAKKHNFIRLINLKKNKGVAYCRNKGIRKAIGNYISFVDSDDRLLSGSIDNILNHIKNFYGKEVFVLGYIYNRFFNSKNNKPTDRTISENQIFSLKSNKGTYWDYSGRTPRDVTMFVNHWDVCLNSKSCAKILNRRGISVHFCIDNDGTIYQLADMQHGCWHAGHHKINGNSVGVEISNAYYLKYQDWYTARFGPRPIVSDAVVHGRTLESHLDFYPVQIEALKALWEAVANACDLPLEAPTKNGELDTGVNNDVKSGKFKGFINHYNITDRKIDCAGLDLVKLLNEVKAD